MIYTEITVMGAVVHEGRLGLGTVFETTANRESVHLKAGGHGPIGTWGGTIEEHDIFSTLSCRYPPRLQHHRGILS